MLIVVSFNVNTCAGIHWVNTGSQPSQLTSRSMNPHFHSPQAIHLTALLNPGGSGTAGTARSLRIDPKKKGL
ncbi:hypothetical protein [Acidovorax sp. RAC01]|uniref:hypothetical protein n=1 Tax=Acidovorax sp. RAC01 TaxID=1842533 RepID=UPI001E4CC8E1|nr:hypothetical protein [Acidovorax sp. RAC01]